ncbi:MAG: PrsW family glutamic-type intramembrane protease [Nannocystaceae bacterium]
MEPLTVVALAFAPGLFWLWVFVRSNRHRPDPIALVIRTFLLGILVALPIVFVESVLTGPGGLAIDTLPEVLFSSFVVAGLAEELAKYLVVRLSLSDSPYLDEPLRGLVYASAAALGFATLENVGYMLDLGVEVIAPRAVTATVGHVAFSALWGYGLGADRLARDDKRPVRGFAILGLVGSIVAHGLYDTGAFLEDREDLLFGTLVAAVAICVALFVRANRRSIHRGRRGARQVVCPGCGARSPLGKPFCAGCGGAVPRGVAPLCGVCHRPVDARSAYCTQCGAKQDAPE